MTQLNNTTGTRLLIIDHDPNELKMLAIGLELEGFAVTGTSSSSEAIKLLDKQQFDAALIDLMMPEMNGLQLARAVRSTSPDMTTILMSAYHLSPVQLARADTGAVGFVPKPFLFDDLVTFIHSKTARHSDSRATLPMPDVTVDSGSLHTPFDVPEVV